MHAEFAVGGVRRFEEVFGSLGIAVVAAGEQHLCVVVLGVREPGSGIEPLVHRECVLVVVFGVVEVSRGGRKEAEVAGDRASHPFGHIHGVQVRIGE